MENALEIRSLSEADGEALSRLLNKQPEGYRQHFFPFPNEESSTLEKVLRERAKDCYWGIFVGSDLKGFFMLRGWDSGYERPSFGVLIDSGMSGFGLGRLALNFALSYCRMIGVPGCMLKVAGENVSARRIYEESGFRKEGECEITGHDILSISFSAGKKDS